MRHQSTGINRVLESAAWTSAVGLALGCVAGTAAIDAPLFIEQARESGLDFVHFNGMSGELLYLETMGAGAALFDFDSDGDLDAYLVQGHMLGSDKSLADAVLPPPADVPLTDRLYRNDLSIDASGRPRLRFVDVTARSGLMAAGYGMGAATGDVDNDGQPDLYVTNFGANQLYHNNGDGTFSDRTRQSRTEDVGWSVPASMFDYDGDGWLDIFLGNYLEFRLSAEHRCVSDTGAPDYCGPLAYRAQQNRLFRNRGDGTFADVTTTAGLTASPPAGTLGLSTADFDNDGWIDVYVANDLSPNNLWINQGDGTFRDDALFAGCAVNADGEAEASMGVDAGDFDGDGDLDLFMAHLTGETNTLFLNDGTGLFRDQTSMVGLGAPSWEFTAFGTAWFDYDNDGHLDLLTVNGAVRRLENLIRAGDPYPLHQRNLLFRNRGDINFEDVSGIAGEAFEHSEVSRGAAFGDIDNDGDTDVVVTNNAGPVRLLINQVGSARQWLGLRALGGVATGGREMLGTRVAVFGADGPPRWRQVRTDGSYASAGDPRILVGLAAAEVAARVVAYWPDRRTTEWRSIPAGSYLVVYEPRPRDRP